MLVYRVPQLTNRRTYRDSLTHLGLDPVLSEKTTLNLFSSRGFKLLMYCQMLLVLQRTVRCVQGVLWCWRCNASAIVVLDAKR